MASPEQDFDRFRTRGDPQALAAVFDAVAAELLLVAAHLAPAGADPEDLLQAMFVDAIEHASRWDASRPLRPWLIGLLVQLARQERRRLARPVDPDRLVRAESTDPATAAATDEAARRIADTIAALPRGYRQVLTLRLVHAMTPTQIAHALDCPVATAKTRLQRGLEMLRRALPPGLAASVLAWATAGRGLAQVRTAVLTHAEAHAAAGAATATTAGATGLILGALAMKKVSLAALAVLSLTLAWSLAWTEPASPTVPGAESIDEAGSVVHVDEANTVSSDAASVREAAPSTPGVADSDPTAATNALALEFVWRHDGTPAAGVRVTALDAKGRTAFSAESTTDGTVDVASVAAGTYFLSGPGIWHRIDVAAAESGRARERVEVEAEVRLDGIVVDSAGRGVGGAHVYVQYFPDSAEVRPRLVAVAGADGRFAGASVSDGYVWAHRDGYAPSTVHPNGERVERRELRLVLGTGSCGMNGTVVGADGRAHGDAELTIVDVSDPETCRAPRTVRTDALGRFTADGLAPGDYLLVAAAANHAFTPLRLTLADGERRTTHLELQLGATVVGTVRDDAGDALDAGLEIRPRWAGGGLPWTESLRPIYHACVVRGGQVGAGDAGFRIANVPAGAVTIETFPRATGLPDERELELVDRERRSLDIVLTTGGTIRGRLVGPDGEPLANWDVRAMPERSGIGCGESTATDGTFAITGLDAPTYAVTARPPVSSNHSAWARRTGVRPGEPAFDLRVDSLPADGAFVVVRLVDVDDTASPRLVLFDRDRDERVEHELEGNDDGVARAGPVRPGRYAAFVRLGTAGSVGLGVHDLAARAEVDLGDVRPPERGTLALRFELPDGTVVEPDELFAWDAAGNSTREFTRAADGAWLGQALPGGTYRLRAWGAAFALSLSDVQVVANQQVPTTVRVEPAAPVRFTFAAHAGVARATLRVRDAADKVVLRHDVQPSGAPTTFARGLRPGRYVFDLDDGTSSAAAGEFTVVGREALDVDVTGDR